MSLTERGEALIEVLSLTFRKELLNRYVLDLGEFYTLHDYVSSLRTENAALKQRNNECLLELGFSSDHIDGLEARLAAAELVVKAANRYKMALGTHGSIQHTYNCGAGCTCGAAALEDALAAYDKAKGET